MADAADKKVTGGDLTASLIQVARRGPAPVHLWNPPYCGEMDLLIRADGVWVHDGTPIGRPAMVQLFASVLKREDDRFYLVTPAEKLGIRVEDAPFLAIDADMAPGAVTFTTNVGERVTAGPGHPLRVETAPDGTPRPYVEVRAGLEALIDRKTFYRLVEAARPGPDGRMALVSGGVSFPLGP